MYKCIFWKYSFIYINTRKKILKKKKQEQFRLNFHNRLFSIMQMLYFDFRNAARNRERTSSTSDVRQEQLTSGKV